MLFQLKFWILRTFFSSVKISGTKGILPGEFVEGTYGRVYQCLGRQRFRLVKIDEPFLSRWIPISHAYVAGKELYDKVYETLFTDLTQPWNLSIEMVNQAKLVNRKLYMMRTWVFPIMQGKFQDFADHKKKTVALQRRRLKEISRVLGKDPKLIPHHYKKANNGNSTEIPEG